MAMLQIFYKAVAMHYIYIQQSLKYLPFTLSYRQNYLIEQGLSGRWHLSDI